MNHLKAIEPLLKAAELYAAAINSEYGGPALIAVAADAEKELREAAIEYAERAPFPFNKTKEGMAFIASGESRETSKKIMVAIAHLARNLDEAEYLWRNRNSNEDEALKEFATAARRRSNR
jgi:hypothetical protein